MKTPLIVIATALIALLIGILLGMSWMRDVDRATPQVGVPAATQQAGPFRISATVNPEIPEIGENVFRLVVTDLNGAPVTDAQVNVVATMPAMGAMPQMRASAAVEETQPGRYEGPFTLSMDGSWPLTLEIDKDGLGQATVRFDMATRRAGLTPISGVQVAASMDEPEALPAGTITVDARRRQSIGVEIGAARRVAMQRRIRAVGRVSYDETLLSDVSLRFDAWIGELEADYVGAVVAAGEPLFTVYGPELLAAQQEYLEVRRRLTTGSLVDAAARRLRLWNLTQAQIDALANRGTPLDYVPIGAPRSGTVVLKNVVEGTAQRAGTTLMRIADLSRVWVEAEVYEADLGLVSVGMDATVTLPYLPDRQIAAEVAYVYPFVDSGSRTVRVRVELDNADGLLKPDMYAEVLLSAELGERLAVPVEAVIFSGDRRVVFEHLGAGRLAPRYIRTRHRMGELIEVVDGLEPGTSIVTSGTFLIAAESRLQSGLDQW